MSLVTSLFCLAVILLNQRGSPALKYQVSDCSTFRTTCDVPSRAVCCSGCIECFPGMASEFIFKNFVTISVALISTGINIYSRTRL
jgi:hypothetical protein